MIAQILEREIRLGAARHHALEADLAVGRLHGAVVLDLERRVGIFANVDDHHRAARAAAQVDGEKGDNAAKDDERNEQSDENANIGAGGVAQILVLKHGELDAAGLLVWPPVVLADADRTALDLDLVGVKVLVECARAVAGAVCAALGREADLLVALLEHTRRTLAVLENTAPVALAVAKLALFAHRAAAARAHSALELLLARKRLGEQLAAALHKVVAVGVERRAEIRARHATAIAGAIAPLALWYVAARLAAQRGAVGGRVLCVDFGLAHAFVRALGIAGHTRRRDNVARKARHAVARVSALTAGAETAGRIAGTALRTGAEQRATIARRVGRRGLIARLTERTKLRTAVGLAAHTETNETGIARLRTCARTSLLALRARVAATTLCVAS